jgi:hypothetical protein
MLPTRTILTAALLAPLLAACASTATVPRPGKTIAGQSVRPPTKVAPRDPAFQQIPGLEGVIGASESQLVQRFGAPRLDVWEGDARKLQFSGQACVLDIYLYPTKESREPLASYADARRSSDGQDVDRAACVTALKGK